MFTSDYISKNSNKYTNTNSHVNSLKFIIQILQGSKEKFYIPKVIIDLLNLEIILC